MAIIFMMGWIYAIYLLLLVILLLITIIKEKKPRNVSFLGVTLFLSELLFTIVGPVIGFWRFDEFRPDIPFAKQHVLTIILLVITSSASFWLARFTKNTTNPIIRIVLSVGMLQGILLCFITTIHFATFIPTGIMIPTLGFELASPLIAFIILSGEFCSYNKVIFNLNELLPYRKEEGFTPLPYQILEFPIFPRLLAYTALFVVLLVVQVALAYACGQDIDALVKAFTHSYGFVFSN